MQKEKRNFLEKKKGKDLDKCGEICGIKRKTFFKILIEPDFLYRKRILNTIEPRPIAKSNYYQNFAGFDVKLYDPQKKAEGEKLFQTMKQEL